ncbi:MAG: type III-B CRISPR module RAMP protein Cmr4 [Candidatus Njordarchaeales archaeon]
MIFLKALTPLHVGAGKGVREHVDLPVQRDEFDIPTIWSSSLKGGFRGGYSRLIRDEKEKGMIDKVFGPPPSRGHEYSSAISFLDAKLIFIPARSLRRIWTYVTSSHLLGYLIVYLEGLDMNTHANSLREFLRNINPPVVSRKDLFVKNHTIVLNELDINRCAIKEDLIEIFANVLPQELVDDLNERGLVIVDDNTIFDIIQRSMIIQYRIRLNYERKVVEVGSLWSEEYIPQGTIFVSGILCRPYVNEEGKESISKEQVLKWFQDKLSNFNYAIWLGGKETIGKGLIKIYFSGGIRSE